MPDHCHSSWLASSISCSSPSTTQPNPTKSFIDGTLDIPNTHNLPAPHTPVPAPISPSPTMQIKRRLSHDDPPDLDVDEYRHRYLDHSRQHRRHKRTRISPDHSLASQTPSRDIISSLPAELLVRVLSYLGETTLLEISTVSRLFHRVTSDHQLWRLHYYRRFILPRAHLIPGFKKNGKPNPASTASLAPSLGPKGRMGGRLSTFDSNDHPGDYVDWKNSYKLLHNWARGRCDVDELELHQRERISPGNTLVKVVEGLAITADATSGLMVWDLRTRSPIAQTTLDLYGPEDDVRPTCLAVEDELLALGEVGIAAGFEDGTFGVWRMDLNKRQLVKICRYDRGPYGELEAVAYCHPYLLAASTSGSISLWTFEQPRHIDSDSKRRDTAVPITVPYMLRSLKSHSTRPPLTLAIRRVAASVVASIAYTLDTVNGWCIGIQDLDIRPSPHHALPEIIDSRVAHTTPTSTRGSASSTPNSSPDRGHCSSPSSSREEDGPMRLCYSHPYLLATLPDNTLLLHLCTTTSTTLSISPGIRLWGHTSGISDAEITTRGKAVSVSARGDEIRVWELEGRFGGSSVEVRPRPSYEQDREEMALATAAASPAVMDYRKNKVGFDDEMVIVLKEAGDGRESLMVYDFT